MEERKISMTFKNDLSSIYEAHYTYAVLKGTLSKKYLLKSVSVVVITEIILTALLFLEDSEFDITTAGFCLMLLLISSVVAIFILKALNKTVIKNFCRTNYEYGFNTKSPLRADFDEEKMLLQSGYSKLTVPYDEFNFVISDRLNFVFGIGNDGKIRNISKINQDPDELFALDNLFREKFGEKFIYKM